MHKMAEGTDTKLSVMIDGDLMVRLKVECAERNEKMKSAVAAAIRGWLATPKQKVKR